MVDIPAEDEQVNIKDNKLLLTVMVQGPKNYEIDPRAGILELGYLHKQKLGQE